MWMGLPARIDEMRIEVVKSVRILAALAVFACLCGCESRESRTVPEELLGVWKTSAPKYRDCYLQLTEESIIFANTAVAGGYNMNRISKIEKVHEGEETLYTIHYKDSQGQEYKLPFFYHPSSGGAIRLKNQSQILWMKMERPGGPLPRPMPSAQTHPG